MMNVVSLFSGIGGVEAGLHRAGHKTFLFCEIDAAARSVLEARFPSVPIANDVRTLKSVPRCDLIAAGFPCQDLSLAGQKAGIAGEQSSLVENLFRLVENLGVHKPKWLLFENVPYMLILDSSRAMRTLVQRLEQAGYRWAYRVVDARSFGLPQRRQRVVLLASTTEDPRSVIFADDTGEPDIHTRPSEIDPTVWYGFYWTMGKMGAGWVREAVPPIKGGSGLGIPSPPAVWIPASDFVGTPEIRDAERLQGFPADWTKPAVEAGHRASSRWKLVGNAVCTPVAEWVGRRLTTPGHYDGLSDPVIDGRRWPKAAWGCKGTAFEAPVSEWPVRSAKIMLRQFLHFDLNPLSAKATTGFWSRARVSKEIAWSPRFLESLRVHIERMSDEAEIRTVPGGKRPRAGSLRA